MDALDPIPAPSYIIELSLQKAQALTELLRRDAEAEALGRALGTVVKNLPKGVVWPGEMDPRLRTVAMYALYDAIVEARSAAKGHFEGAAAA